ncbi:MAG TPA: polysaccharide biosynthesis tyrosine autokinase [Chthoniobacteraceae bacterium]|nr:polysaccharide biosynthesis tyrosine autokinase [Chthoniobacteraceae bacterium]
MNTETTSNIPTARDWATKIGIKAYRYRALVQRRWWILAAAVCVGLLCEAVVLIRQPVQYESVGKLIVSGGLSETDAPTVHAGNSSDEFDTTVINILEGDKMKENTQTALSLSDPKGHGEVLVQAKVEPRSSIFDVVGHGPNPEFTRSYVDELMNQFIAYRRDQDVIIGESVANSLRQQMDETQAKLESQQKALQDFKNAHPFWEEERKDAADRLATLRKNQSDDTVRLKQLTTLKPEEILNRNLLNDNSPGNPQSTPGGSDTMPSSDLSQKYFQARQDMAQKQAELEEKLKVWTPQHPGIKLINDQIKSIQVVIDTITKESDQVRNEQIAQLQTDLKNLEATMVDWTKKAEEAERLNGEYELKLSAVNNTQNSLEDIRKKYEQVHIQPASETNMSILQEAKPGTKVPAGVVKHLLIGLILGLVIGGVVLYVIDRADDRISSSTEMVEHFAESLLGQIPNVSDSRVEAGLPLLQHDDPRYTYAEAFRSLRSSLIFMPNQGELKTLIITSSIPGEGKSTITSNLAITLAIAGARVLVVDSDLRRGDLASLFDVDGRLGLSSVLRGEAEWRNVVQKTRLPNLTLLPRGPVTNQSGELLLLPTFEPMMEDFKNNFDLILFNTSPILATDDTPTIAPHFDGTLMVIRASFTSAKLVQNSLNSLYQRQVNVLGLILNCVDTEMPDYYYYRYPKYYAV